MTTATQTYKAETFIRQGEEEFRCGWDFTGPCDEASAITHLSEILSEAAMGEGTFEDENEDDFNFYGMTPKEFATLIVKDEEAAKEMYGTTWEICPGECCD